MESSSIKNNMKPIAKLDLGLDEESGLNKELQVWQFTCDVKSEVIIVVYDIVLLSPTGKTISIVETNSYRRIANDFNNLRNSDIGVEISNMIQNNINNYPNF